MLGHKITISEKFVAKLLNHDGFRRRCYGMLPKKKKMEEIVEVIFVDGKPFSYIKQLKPHLKI